MKQKVEEPKLDVNVICKKEIPHLCAVGETGFIDNYEYFITNIGYGYWVEGSYQPWYSYQDKKEKRFNMNISFLESQAVLILGKNFNIADYFEKV